jgi:hypothetical protein
VPSPGSRNSSNYARAGKIHCDHRCDRDAGGISDVERLRPEVAGTTAGGYPDRARTFGILFSHRYLHHPQHCFELALFDLLNLPALKLREDACALLKLREIETNVDKFRTKCFGSAMSLRIAFSLVCPG